MLSNYIRKAIYKLLLLSTCFVALVTPLSLAAVVDATEANNNLGLSMTTNSQPPIQATPLESNARTKLGRHIDQLLSQDSLASRSSSAALSDTAYMRFKHGSLAQIYITLNVVSNSTLDLIRSLGVEIELVNQQLRKVQGWASVNTIEALRNDKHVELIETPKYAQPRAGTALTQGDAIVKSNLLRQLGFRGKDIKVGIVSDGSNNWTTARASGNLPSSITQYGSCTIRAESQTICRSARTCNEGTAMAEIIHDIAPDASLAVASVNTSLEFIARINQLANSFGADVIVDDLGFFGEPYFADGDLANAVQALPSHVLYVSSAGNAGHVHYQAPYAATDGSLHNFSATPTQNSDNAMGFVIAARRGAFALLQWDDPFNAAQSDFDLYVSDLNGPVGQSVSRGSTPFEAACIYNSSYSDKVFFAQIDKFSGDDKQLKIFLLGAGAIEYPMRQGSIFGHAATSRAVAVGSVQASDPGHDTIAFYSSGGPGEIRVPTIQTRRKPDLVAIDGVSVSGAGGFPTTFYGTSAAAPHVAGVAALLMSAYPKVRTNDIRVALTRSAKDLGSKGFDTSYGYGLVNALEAYERLPLPNPAPAIMLLLDDDAEP
jgi:subtilisin family serine protease